MSSESAGKKGRGLLIAVAVVVVLAVVVVGAWVLKKTFKGAPIQGKLPADTALFVSLDVEKNVKAYKRFMKKTGEKDYEERLIKLLEDILKDADLKFDIGDKYEEYKDNLKSWVGGQAALAMSEEAVMEGKEQIALLVNVRSEKKAPKKFKELIEDVVETAGEQKFTWDETEYKDVEITCVAESDNMFCFAVFDGMMAIGPLEYLKDLIKYSDEGGDSLADTDGFKDLAKQLPDDTIVYAMFNLTSLQKEMKKEIQGEMREATPDWLMREVEMLKSLGLYLASDGIDQSLKLFLVCDQKKAKDSYLLSLVESKGYVKIYGKPIVKMVEETFEKILEAGKPTGNEKEEIENVRDMTVNSFKMINSYTLRWELSQKEVSISLESDLNEKELKEWWTIMEKMVETTGKNFGMMQNKSKQSEARTNLSAIFTAQKSHHGLMNTYGQTFREIDWEPYGTNMYNYYLADDVIYSRKGQRYDLYDIKNLVQGQMPYADQRSFRVLAVANLDRDSTLDIWMIDENKNLYPIVDDVRQ